MMHQPIDRVDRQGSREPPRYTRARKGDPVAVRENWTNYVKATPHSIFHERYEEAETRLVPRYPDAITDVHYLDRVFDLRQEGAQDTQPWNAALRETLKEIGPATKGNIILLITDRGEYFARVIERTWLRGKSNDTVVVMGVENDTVIWAHAFGWAEKPTLYINLREELPGTPFAPDAVLDVVGQEVLDGFKPLPSNHFAYLKNDIRLSATGYILLLLLSLGLSVATTIFFHRTDKLS